MTNAYVVPGPAPRAAHATTTSPALDPPLARRVLANALLLGITGDSLLEPSLLGLALPVWIALVAVTLVAATWSTGRSVTRQAAGWLTVAVAFAGTVAWRGTDELRVAGLLATLAALLMAVMSQRDAASVMFAACLRDTLWSARNALLGIVTGMVPLALREALAHSSASWQVRRGGPVVRAAVLTTLLVVIFGSLLRGADPVFASLLSLPDIDLRDALPHLLLAGFFACLAAGWMRAALDRRLPPAFPVLPRVTLGSVEITTSLGALVALFATYVLAQLGWFFGGERFLQAHTGLTAAAYARTGFFQMLWVVLLVIPVLLATRAMLAPGRVLERRHTVLALPLVALLGVMILSASSRLVLYVHYFGLTSERFYPMVFMGWLGVVLIWFACTVLRGRGHRFVAGTIVSALLVLSTLDVLAPDVMIARVNVARATPAPGHSAPPLDLVHLASLGGEAVPLVVDMTIGTARQAHGIVPSPNERCVAAQRLLKRWGTESHASREADEPGAWRHWNAGEALARRVVREHETRLQLVGRGTCLPESSRPAPSLAQ